VADQVPILVVDDDEPLRTMMQLALEDEGYPVVSASDGAEALEAVQAQRPRLILLDMRMPRVNGWEFAAAYRKLPGPHAPIVVVTAGHDAAQKAREIAADDHLGKPFDLDQLFAVVERHL
jgi:CheY-like chemotaxis protein